MWHQGAASRRHALENAEPEEFMVSRRDDDVPPAEHGMVDVAITGSDRVTRTGDAANKIGTYLKALAAYDNNVPFYVALPSSTFDWTLRDGIREIPVEERDPAEVHSICGATDDGVRSVRLTPEGSRAANYGFDVTPARLITGLMTERGICDATEEDILRLFPERTVQ